MSLFISIPASMAPVANAAAAANFDDSVNIFVPNASASGALPATHCVCAVNATEDGETKIRELAAALGGQVTTFDDPLKAWTAHGLKPIFVEKSI